MKLMKVLLGAAALLISVNSFSQDDENRECDRMRFLGSKAIEVNNYQEAASYYLKGEEICGDFDAAKYKILKGCFMNAASSETDKDKKKAYMDTLTGVFDRMEEKGFYDNADDCFRAYAILSSSKADPRKADELFSRCLDAKGATTEDYYLTYYYYNLYVMWTQAKEEQKGELKQRLISDYFRISRFISEANYPARVQESIAKYFNNVVRNCDDILPDLKKFMGSLSQDKEVKKATVTNFIKLLDEKGCTESEEYIMLIDTLISVGDGSVETLMMKGKAQEAKKDYKGAITTFKEVKSKTSDDELNQEATYRIASCQYSIHSYSAAYQTAMTVSGENKGKALIIAGLSVGANVNNCGDSDFQRRCNYLYAVDLLQQGKNLGASDNGNIASFKAKFPTPQQCFDNGNPASVTLNCYGVSVSPCN